MIDYVQKKVYMIFSKDNYVVHSFLCLVCLAAWLKKMWPSIGLDTKIQKQEVHKKY